MASSQIQKYSHTQNDFSKCKDPKLLKLKDALVHRDCGMVRRLLKDKEVKLQILDHGVIEFLNLSILYTCCVPLFVDFLHPAEVRQVEHTIDNPLLIAAGTALIQACIHRRDESVLTLLMFGANPNVSYSNGATPISISIWCRGIENCKQLIKHGATFDPEILENHLEAPYYEEVTELFKSHESEKE